MQLIGGKHRQVKHGNPRALQNQPVSAAFVTQPPAQIEQHQPRQRDTDIAIVHRQVELLGSKPQQKSQPDKQQHHAHAQHGIAARQPGKSARQQAGF